MKTRLLSVLFGAVLGGFIAQVFAFEELGKASLELMQKPAALLFVSGTEVHWLRDDWHVDGRAFTIYYELVDVDMVTAKDSDGCSRTSMTYMFAPTLQWKNCKGRGGIQTITDAEGSPWPLSDETSFQYTFTGSWSDGLGRVWHSTRKCKVDNQVRVKVPAGEYESSSGDF